MLNDDQQDLIERARRNPKALTGLERGRLAALRLHAPTVEERAVIEDALGAVELAAPEAPWVSEPPSILEAGREEARRRFPMAPERKDQS